MSELVGAILAGGASRRFGRDKAQVRIGEATSLEVVSVVLAAVCGEVIVVGGEGPLPAGVGRVNDLFPGEGPLQGVLSALSARPGCDALVLACDMPWVTSAFLEHLITAAAPEAVATVPLANGRWQPLGALYRAAAQPLLEAAWQSGERSLTRALAELPVHCLDVAGPGVLDDFDTPTDLAQRLSQPRG